MGAGAWGSHPAGHPPPPSIPGGAQVGVGAAGGRVRRTQVPQLKLKSPSPVAAHPPPQDAPPRPDAQQQPALFAGAEADPAAAQATAAKQQGASLSPLPANTPEGDEEQAPHSAGAHSKPRAVLARRRPMPVWLACLAASLLDCRQAS